MVATETEYDECMADKKKAKRFPSRDKVKYVPIPVEMWAELESIGKPDERSVSYMTRKAIRQFLERVENQETEDD